MKPTKKDYAVANEYVLAKFIEKPWTLDIWSFMDDLTKWAEAVIEDVPLGLKPYDWRLLCEAMVPTLRSMVWRTQDVFFRVVKDGSQYVTTTADQDDSPEASDTITIYLGSYAATACMADKLTFDDGLEVYYDDRSSQHVGVYTVGESKLYIVVPVFLEYLYEV